MTRVWQFTEVDNALEHTGQVDYAGITIEPQTQTNVTSVAEP